MDWRAAKSIDQCQAVRSNTQTFRWLAYAVALLPLEVRERSRVPGLSQLGNLAELLTVFEPSKHQLGTSHAGIVSRDGHIADHQASLFVPNRHPSLADSSSQLG
jgi:hypothetical protein